MNGEYELSAQILREKRWQEFGGRLQGLQPFQMHLIRKAFDFADTAHATQKWESNDGGFIQHPLDVATIICNEFDIKDPNLIAATIMHDTIEDTPYFANTGDLPFSISYTQSILNLADQFNWRIARLVGGVTKAKLDGKEIPDKPFLDNEYYERFVNIPRYAQILKLADKLHALRNPKKDEAKQQEVIDEVDVYLKKFKEGRIEKPEPPDKTELYDRIEHIIQNELANKTTTPIMEKA